MRQAKINDKWELKLPDHRADFHEARPSWEAPRLADMYDRLESGQILFDIGAEQGDLTALYASWGLEMTIVEPQPAYWPFIRETFEANNLTWLDIHIGFASDRRIDRPAPEIPEEGIADFGFMVMTQHECPERRIDDMLYTPDALMIDVEGAELRVLKGARETLETHHPTVWVSVHPAFMRDEYGDNAVDLLVFMRELGYTATFLDDDHEEDWRFD